MFGTDAAPAYKYVFIASGVGMLVSLVWFYVGRARLKGIGAPEPEAAGLQRVVYVAIGALFAIPVVYFLLALGGQRLQYVLTVLFIILAVMLVMEGIREGKVARDKVIAMMIIFTFNILFWMFFEQAGSSFTFLADEIVNRNLGSFVFPTAWFQSVNSVAIIVLAPIIAWVWIQLGERQPVDPAQVRPRADLQRPRVPAADVRAVEPRQRRRQDPVLDAGRGLRDPVRRRVVPLADRPVDGDQARARCGSSASAWADGSCRPASATTCRGFSPAPSAAKAA